MKKILKLKFFEPGGGWGGGYFSNKLIMACALNLKALIIIFELIGVKSIWFFNDWYC
jgi:hypothetical protein